MFDMRKGPVEGNMLTGIGKAIRNGLALLAGLVIGGGSVGLYYYMHKDDAQKEAQSRIAAGALVAQSSECKLMMLNAKKAFTEADARACLNEQAKKAGYYVHDTIGDTERRF